MIRWWYLFTPADNTDGTHFPSGERPMGASGEQRGIETGVMTYRGMRVCVWGDSVRVCVGQEPAQGLDVVMRSAARAKSFWNRVAHTHARARTPAPAPAPAPAHTHTHNCHDQSRSAKDITSML